MVTRPIAAHLLSHPALQQGLKAGAYFFILWVSKALSGWGWGWGEWTRAVTSQQ